MDELPSLDSAREAFRFESLINDARSNRGSQATNGEFGDLLTRTIEELDQLNQASDQAFQGLLSGEEQDLHGVMIRMNEADLAMRFALEVRNRLIESYQELTRMPI